MSKCALLTIACLLSVLLSISQTDTWIRINQLGYPANGSKVAVLGSKSSLNAERFELVDAKTKKVVFSGSAGRSFGAYGPFNDSYRLDFSSFRKNGTFVLRAGNTESPVFKIGGDVYEGAADFCLKYMQYLLNNQATMLFV